MQFSSPSEARQALQSNVPVFNDRLIEVHACSSDLLHAPTASLPADADSTAGKAAGNRGKQDEMDKKLSLIHQRQMQKIKELTFYRTQVAKLLKLLPLYVSLWERSSDESRAAQEDRNIVAVVDRRPPNTQSIGGCRVTLNQANNTAVAASDI